MFLSNARRGFTLLGPAILAILSSCGSQNTANDAVTPPPPVTGKFAFSTIEPREFQGEFVVTSGGVEQRWFLARKGDLSRMDFFSGTDRWRIEIGGPRSYSILPIKKVYSEKRAPGTLPPQPTAAEQAARQLFANADHRQYEPAGMDGDLVKYRGKASGSTKDEITVWVSPASGLIVRQQFAGADGSGYTYEVRDLSLTVSDDVFVVPADCKRVSQAEFERSAAANK